MIELNCPNCQTDFDVEHQLWNFETTCPHCYVELYVDYDFTVLADEDEWPHWYVSVIKR